MNLCRKRGVRQIMFNLGKNLIRKTQIQNIYTHKVYIFYKHKVYIYTHAYIHTHFFYIFIHNFTRFNLLTRKCILFQEFLDICFTKILSEKGIFYVSPRVLQEQVCCLCSLHLLIINTIFLFRFKPTFLRVRSNEDI